MIERVSGWNLDALVAQHVTGWSALVDRGGRWDGFPPGGGNSIFNLEMVPLYSTDCNDAALVLKAMKQRKFRVGAGDTWEKFSYQFTATGPTTIAFYNMAASGVTVAGLDDVSISAAPEPSTWALLGVGASLLGLTVPPPRRSRVKSYDARWSCLPTPTSPPPCPRAP